MLVVELKKLTSGLEDYLEAIYLADINKKSLKGADLARQLGISRASVSEALSKLVAKGLIKYNSYEAISITPQGTLKAQQIYQKHHILEDFFENVLGIDKEEASENACRIEHIISQNVFDKLVKFNKFCKENKNLINKSIS